MTPRINPIALCDKPECPSELSLERMLAGELTFEAKRELEVRIADCAGCQTRLRQIQQGFSAFPELDTARVWARLEASAAAPPDAWWARAAAFVTQRRGAWISAGVVAALGLLIVARTPETSQPSDAPALRAKGSLALRVHRQRKSGSEPMLSGDHFAPGDKLRFEIDTPRAGHLMIVGVEADGDRYVAWPAGSDSSAMVEASAHVLLPGAVELDQSTGRETLYLVQCSDSFALTDCQVSVDGLRCAQSCSLTSFAVDKR